jgi:ribosome biogenesis GTPase
LTDVYGRVYDTLTVSALAGPGMDALKARLVGRRAAFAGPSGVGKSSIINFLLGRDEIGTGALSRKTKRGKHTTRHVEIFETDFDAELFDTPGYTSFEGVSAEPAEVAYLFPEIAARSGKCRFDDCTHTDEPDCAVLGAVLRGEIAKSRYDSYRRMLGEAVENKRKGATN